MSESLNLHVAQEIRVALVRAGRTQTDLAKALGCSPATLARRLTGKSAFDLDELTTVAAFLDLPTFTVLLPVEVAA